MLPSQRNHDTWGGDTHERHHRAAGTRLVQYSRQPGHQLLHAATPTSRACCKLHLGDALYRELESQLVSLGQRASDELDVWALSADKNPPQLRHRTRRGEALQSIDKHPDYVALERVAYAELGLASMSHDSLRRSGKKRRRRSSNTR